MASHCEKAAVQMGMVAWETVALGLPTYIFSPTEDHLRYALAMDEAGLVFAYPEVGLPGPEALEAFLQIPYEITGTPPDGRAAERILKLMEDYNG